MQLSRFCLNRKVSQIGEIIKVNYTDTGTMSNFFKVKNRHQNNVYNLLKVFSKGSYFSLEHLLLCLSLNLTMFSLIRIGPVFKDRKNGLVAFKGFYSTLRKLKSSCLNHTVLTIMNGNYEIVYGKHVVSLYDGRRLISFRVLRQNSTETDGLINSIQFFEIFKMCCIFNWFTFSLITEFRKFS